MQIEGLETSDLDFDKNNLDREWLRQMQLVRLASDALADARYKVDKLKSLIEVTEAELRLKIVATPTKYGCSEKATVAEINSAVAILLHKKPYVQRLQKAKHAVDLIQSFVNALETKRKAMENEVTLFVHNYYSIPREPEGGGNALEDMREATIAKKGVTGTLKRKRSKHHV